MKKELGFGYCGLVCALCEENTHCVGCKQGGCPNKENCKNYQCCTTNGYQSCYECKSFPCEDSILMKKRIQLFCKLIGQYGENKILALLEKNEKKGIQYHYDYQIIGDYDFIENEKEMYAFLLNDK